MIRLLFQHQWKKFFRSPDRGRNIFTTVLSGLLLLLMLFYTIGAGVMLPVLLSKAIPGKSPVIILNGVILYYIIFSFLLRWILQGIPVQDIDYYRMFPVKKRTLINSLLLKSLFNAFNIIAVFFFISFTCSAVIKEYSLFTAAAWLISILVLEIANGNFVFYLQKKIAWKHGLLVPLLTILFIFAVYELFTSFSIKIISAWIMGGILNCPVLFLIPVLLLVAVYFLNYITLERHFYSDDLKKRKIKDKKFRSFSVFDSMGEIGLYMALELKMIFRNRRPRALFFYSFIFLLCQVTVYMDSNINVEIHSFKNLFMIYFWSVFGSSFALITYGQNLFAWEGGYFDFICSGAVDIKKYIHAKYYISVLSIAFFFVLLIPYAFVFGIRVFWFNTAGAIYSMGITSAIMLILGPLNKKRIDLNTGMMSMQGRDSSGQFIKGLQLVLPLGTIYLIAKLIGFSDYIFHIIAAAGIIGIIFRNKAINIAHNQFNKRRYKMAAGFRQS